MNKKMKMRFLSLLLCLVMLFGLIPISTYAAAEEEITSLSVNVLAPAAGEAPDTSGITIGTTGIRISSAQWYVYKKDVGYATVNKFTAGGTYTLLIKYEIADGYTVSGSAAILHDLTGGQAEHNASAKTIMIEYKVPEITAPITSVKISDVTEPVIGAMPDFDITLTGTGAVLYEYEEDEWEPITWDKLNPETGEWESMDVDTSFGAGVYCLGVALESEEGYEFTADTKFYYNDDELPEFDGDYESNYERWDGGADIYLYFTLEEPAAESTSITSVKISDVTEPVIGAAPDWDITLTGEGLAHNDGDGYDYAGWYKINKGTSETDADEWVPLDKDTPFSAGLYVLEVYLYAEDGYEFTDATKCYFDEEVLPAWGDSYDSGYSWWGVGKYAEIFLCFTLEEPAAEPTPITSVKISDVTEPVIGAIPDCDITITGEGAIINETIDVSWYKCDPESDEWEAVEDEDTPFGPGLYRLEVYLCAEDGYEFNDATKFYFDEEALSAWDGSYDSGYYWWGIDGYAAIFLSFTPKEALTPPETEAPERENVTAVFDDVYNDWYTEYVQYVYNNDLMTGIKGTRHFAPNDNITKAQVAQVLYNMEGKPGIADRSVFTELKDVYESEWYADAVAWAYNMGVVTGDLNAKKFFPNADVTREQLALMMYRYAKYKAYDVSHTSDFAGLTGAEKIADWAKDGVTWAVGAGLISGIEKNGVKDIAPQGNASRAQVAAILQRFCENVIR